MKFNPEAFGDDGVVRDESTAAFLRHYMEEYAAFVQRVLAANAPGRIGDQNPDAHKLSRSAEEPCCPGRPGATLKQFPPGRHLPMPRRTTLLSDTSLPVVKATLPVVGENIQVPPLLCPHVEGHPELLDGLFNRGEPGRRAAAAGPRRVNGLAGFLG